MKNWISLSVPIGFILCGIGIVSLTIEKTNPKPEQATSLPEMEANATYYVFISEIEVYNKALDGDDEEDWDDDDDAPDLFYTIEYQGKKVFKSPQRDNTFIGNWRGITLPIALRDLSEAIKGDISVGIDFEQIVHAARIKGNFEITIKIYDHDSLTPTDDVGTLKLSMAELKEGINTFHNDNRKEDNGWKQVQINVVKREGSVKDYLLPLLREMTQETAN